MENIRLVQLFLVIPSKPRPKVPLVKRNHPRRRVNVLTVTILFLGSETVHY
jgi:hypothetical protein